MENITQVWLGGDHYKWRQMRQWNRRAPYYRRCVPREMKETLERGDRKPAESLESSELQRYFDIMAH